MELRVVTQPDQIWFKDTGGRSKHLTATVQLLRPVPGLQRFPLVIDLYLEGGHRVDEQWQSAVLNVLNPQHELVVDAENPCTIRFRLERVRSRTIKSHTIMKPRGRHPPTAPFIRPELTGPGRWCTCCPAHSTNFSGERFMLRIRPKEGTLPASCGVEPVFSRAVMSKVRSLAQYRPRSCRVTARV